MQIDIHYIQTFFFLNVYQQYNGFIKYTNKFHELVSLHMPTWKLHDMDWSWF